MATRRVSKRALMQRVNRRLAVSKRVLKLRGGCYFVVDLELNRVVHDDVDLEEFGRGMGALAGWERCDAH